MQEAIWDGTPFATFIQRFSELENEQSSAASWITAPQTNTIPEHARFADIVIADKIDKHGRGSFVCARYRHETDGLIELSEHKINLSA